MNGIQLDVFVSNFFTILLAVAGLITAVGGAIAVIKKGLSQTKANKNSEVIEGLKEKLENHEDRITKLEDKTDTQDEFIKVICNSMLALLSHNINGNSKDKLEEAQKEIQEFLVKNK